MNSKWIKISLLCIVLLLAGFFRFHRLQSLPPGLYPDEAINGNNAVEAMETHHLKSFYPENNGREGLYINTLVLVFKVWPHYEPWVVRLPAAVSGVLTVLGTYLLAAELFGTPIGLLSALLVAVSHWPVIQARMGFRANFAVMLLVWASYYAFLTLKRSSPWAWFYAVLGGTIYGLSFYTYIPIRITPVLFILLAFFYRHDRVALKRLLAFGVTCLIVIIPIAVYFIHNPGEFVARTSDISVMNSAHPVTGVVHGFASELAMLGFHGDRNWRHNIWKASELALPVALLFWFAFLAGFRELNELRRSVKVRHATETADRALPLVFLYCWFFVTLIPPSLAGSVPSALRSILMFPAVLIFAAIGGVKCFQYIQQKTAGRTPSLVAGAFCLWVVGYGYVHYFRTYAENPNVPQSFASADFPSIRAINALPASTPKYVVIDVLPGEKLTRGFPMAAETTMFLTHSFTEQDRDARSIKYFQREEDVPKNAPKATVFHIGLVRN